jgi:hypothetical protein
MGGDRPPPLKPASLTVTDAARLLGLPEGLIQADIDEGVPVGPDGTINLVNYAAWLNSHGD